jgi:hypothetical protein
MNPEFSNIFLHNFQSYITQVNPIKYHFMQNNFTINLIF